MNQWFYLVWATGESNNPFGRSHRASCRADAFAKAKAASFGLGVLYVRVAYRTPAGKCITCRPWFKAGRKVT